MGVQGAVCTSLVPIRHPLSHPCLFPETAPNNLRARPSLLLAASHVLLALTNFSVIVALHGSRCSGCMTPLWAASTHAVKTPQLGMITSAGERDAALGPTHQAPTHSGACLAFSRIGSHNCTCAALHVYCPVFHHLLQAMPTVAHGMYMRRPANPPLLILLPPEIKSSYERCVGRLVVAEACARFPLFGWHTA